MPTLSGKAKVKVPAGFQPDGVLRLVGEGLPFDGSDRRGDIFIRVSVRVPKTLRPEEKALYRQLRDLEQGKKKQ